MSKQPKTILLPIALLSDRVFGQSRIQDRAISWVLPQRSRLQHFALTALSVKHTTLSRVIPRARCTHADCPRGQSPLAQIPSPISSTQSLSWRCRFGCRPHSCCLLCLPIAPSATSGLCRFRGAPQSWHTPNAPLTSRLHSCRTSLSFCCMPAASTTPSTPRVSGNTWHQTRSASWMGYYKPLVNRLAGVPPGQATILSWSVRLLLQESGLRRPSGTAFAPPELNTVLPLITTQRPQHS